RAGWLGGFLKFDPARFGLINSPKISGEVVFTSPAGPGWLNATNRFTGLHLRGKRVVLEYTVDETRVLDTPWLETRGDLKIFTRSLELAPCKRAMKLVVSASSNGVAISAGPRVDRAIVQLQKTVLAVATLGEGVHLANENNKLIVEFAAHHAPRRVK